MNLKKLEDVIPNCYGRTLGELTAELLEKGYGNEEADQMVNQFISDLPSPNPLHSKWTDEYTGTNPKFIY